MVETITSDSHRSTGAMEIFLLAAISRGALRTLYALQQVAGLQPGSVRGVLKALEAAGLLVRSEIAQRGRRRRIMTVTEAGKEFLDARWKEGLDPNREMESVLRGATLALAMGQIEEAIRFLHDAANKRLLRQGPQELGGKFAEMGPFDLHAEMRTVFENRRRVMEAYTLQESGKVLMEVARKRDSN